MEVGVATNCYPLACRCRLECISGLPAACMDGGGIYLIMSVYWPQIMHSSHVVPKSGCANDESMFSPAFQVTTCRCQWVAMLVILWALSTCVPQKCPTVVPIVVLVDWCLLKHFCCGRFCPCCGWHMDMYRHLMWATVLWAAVFGRKGQNVFVDHGWWWPSMRQLLLVHLSAMHDSVAVLIVIILPWSMCWHFSGLWLVSYLVLLLSLASGWLLLSLSSCQHLCLLRR